MIIIKKEEKRARKENKNKNKSNKLIAIHLILFMEIKIPKN